MHWLIQRKFEYDRNYLRLLESLDRLKIPYSYCKVIPFTEDGIEWEGERPSPDTKCFASGSYTLAKIAKKYYKPGAFISENLDMGNIYANYREEMFNKDLILSSIREADPEKKGLKKFFIRPIKDSKSFTGQVMTVEEFEVWRKRLYELPKDEFSTVTLNTIICYSSIKPIDFEVRFFIVDGKPVTWSEYKNGNTVAYKEHVDEYIVDYVKRLIGNPDLSQPEKAYVLDIAVTDGIPKVLETNCINAVGLYAIDTQKLVMAIEDL